MSSPRWISERLFFCFHSSDLFSIVPSLPLLCEPRVYGVTVTTGPPACENIGLQKHPRVRGCVNGAFSAGPVPILRATDWRTTNGILCVRREGREREGERVRETAGESWVLRTFQFGAPVLCGLIVWPVWPLSVQTLLKRIQKKWKRTFVVWGFEYLQLLSVCLLLQPMSLKSQLYRSLRLY